MDGSEAEAVAYRINPSIHLQKTLRYCSSLDNAIVLHGKKIVHSADLVSLTFPCLHVQVFHKR